MNAKNRKTLTIDLIANDIINSKLIYGLNTLDIDAGTYALFLEAPILSLIGFNKKQLTLEVHDLYASLVKSKSIAGLKIDNFDAIRDLAKEIYQELSNHLPPEGQT